MTTISSIQPLFQWGGFQGQRRLSDSPYIQSVWEGIANQDGTHLTAADGVIDIAFQKRQGLLRVLLSGPTSRFRTTTFEAGDEFLTIRLRTGVHLPFITSKKLADIDQFLPNVNKHHFWLQSTPVRFPDFNNVEVFIERLARIDLLRRSIVIENVLDNKSHTVSSRTIQRYFLATTGLTLSHIRQIRRAEAARSLLGGDLTLTSVAYKVGYSNPAHMTHAFKYFFGRTPSVMRTLMN